MVEDSRISLNRFTLQVLQVLILQGESVIHIIRITWATDYIQALQAAAHLEREGLLHLRQQLRSRSFLRVYGSSVSVNNNWVSLRNSLGSKRWTPRGAGLLRLFGMKLLWIGLEQREITKSTLDTYMTRKERENSLKKRRKRNEWEKWQGIKRKFILDSRLTYITSSLRYRSTSQVDRKIVSWLGWYSSNQLLKSSLIERLHSSSWLKVVKTKSIRIH